MSCAPAHETDGDDCESPKTCGVFVVLLIVVKRLDDAAGPGAGHASVDGLFQACPDTAGNFADDCGSLEQGQDGRGDTISGLHLFELELVAPGDEGSPDDLVGGNDNQYDHCDSGKECANIAGVCSSLQITAKARELEIAITHGEHFARDKGKPSARDGDDGVPDEADCGVGHFKLPEALPGRVTIDSRSLEHLFRDAFQRGIEAESEVPNLTGEYQQDNAHLDSELMARNEGYHCEHNWRKKTKYRDRLKYVEGRNHPRFDAGVVGGRVAVGDCESKTQQVRDADANDGVKGIHGQCADGMRDGNDRDGHSHPILASVDDRKEDGQTACGDTYINDEWPRADHDQRAGERVLEGTFEPHSDSSLAATSSCDSGSMKRRRAASKSKSSA